MTEATRALWVFLPVLGGYLAHAPVLRFDLWPALNRPLDGGRTLRGRRLLGPNKTWRGVVVMWAGVMGATVLLSSWRPVASHWPPTLRQHVPVFGALLGLGFVAGELPNSFLKRQLDVQAGRRGRGALGVVISIFDQADFVPGIWLTLLPLWVMSLIQAATVFAVAVVVHLFVNVLGRLLGARDTWL